MKKLFLFDGSGSNNSPEWWLNFIKSEIGDNATIPQTQAVLAQYGAKFVFTRKTQNGKIIADDRYLEFEDESAASMFLLRWHINGNTNN